MTSHASSVEETRLAIDNALKSSGYSCRCISWDDGCRYSVGGSLSSWGKNITDTRLKAKDGTQLYTVRSDNWNEKLGVIDASQLSLLVDRDNLFGLTCVTLAEFLRAPHANGAGYTGMLRGTDLSSLADTKVSIRFQTVFLPVAINPATGRGTMQFATEAYNYATQSDNNPRNLILLSTTQGLSVQADGKGSKCLFLHSRVANGQTGQYWLEAETTRHDVGGEQHETFQERMDAKGRGKATSEVIDIKAMGSRFNVLMTIQVPLVQKDGNIGFGASPGGFTFGGMHPSFAQAQVAFGSNNSNTIPAFGGGNGGFGGNANNAVFGGGFACIGQEAPSYFGSKSATPAFGFGGSGKSTPFGAFQTAGNGTLFGAGPNLNPAEMKMDAPTKFGGFGTTNASAFGQQSTPFAQASFGGGSAAGVGLFGGGSGLFGKPPPLGRANAARVSRGDYHGMYFGLQDKNPHRHRQEHITVTCVLYNTVTGGVPSAADCLAAVEDMNRLYAACSDEGHLAENKFSFMKTPVNKESAPNKFPSPPSIQPQAQLTQAQKMDAMVRSKLQTMSVVPFYKSDIHELKLLILGALKCEQSKNLLASKFQQLEMSPFFPTTIPPDFYNELKLLVLGALSNERI